MSKEANIREILGLKGYTIYVPVMVKETSMVLELETGNVDEIFQILVGFKDSGCDINHTKVLIKCDSSGARLNPLVSDLIEILKVTKTHTMYVFKCELENMKELLEKIQNKVQVFIATKGIEDCSDDIFFVELTLTGAREHVDSVIEVLDMLYNTESSVAKQSKRASRS